MRALYAKVQATLGIPRVRRDTRNPVGQSAWLPVLRTLKADFWSAGRLQVSRAGNVFDANGDIVDENIRERLRSFVQDFAEYAGSRRRQ